jgi:hypothetical protein
MKKHSLAGLDTGCWTAPLLRPDCWPLSPRRAPFNESLSSPLSASRPLSVTSQSLHSACLLFAAPLSAEDNPLKWASKYQPLADHLSTGNRRGQRRRADHRQLGRRTPQARAFLQQGCETGFVVLVSEVGNRLVHRTRPDGSDDKSWPSEHTAVAGANVRWAPSVAIPLGGVHRLRANGGEQAPFLRRGVWRRARGPGAIGMRIHTANRQGPLMDPVTVVRESPDGAAQLPDGSHARSVGRAEGEDVGVVHHRHGTLAAMAEARQGISRNENDGRPASGANGDTGLILVR